MKNLSEYESAIEKCKSALKIFRSIFDEAHPYTQQAIRIFESL